MRWGQNVSLPEADIKRAALERVQRLAQTRHKAAPGDLLEFMDRADIVYLDAEGRRVEFVRAIVTWNED